MGAYVNRDKLGLLVSDVIPCKLPYSREDNCRGLCSTVPASKSNHSEFSNIWFFHIIALSGPFLNKEKIEIKIPFHVLQETLAFLGCDKFKIPRQNSECSRCGILPGWSGLHCCRPISACHLLLPSSKIDHKCGLTLLDQGLKFHSICLRKLLRFNVQRIPI